MKKYLNIIFVGSIFYVIIRLLLRLLSFRNLETENFLYYNASDGFTWYLIYLIFPIFGGIIISILLKNKNTLENFGKYFFITLLLSTIIGTILNNNYWGYLFKRPTVFSELKNANEFLSLTEFEKEKDKKTEIKTDTTLYQNVEISSDYYYDIYERPIKAMLSNWKSRGNLHDWERIYKSNKAKLSSIEINSIFDTISKSNYLEKPEKKYSETGNNYTGIIIEFTNSKVDNVSFGGLNETRKPNFKNDKVYYFVTLKSGQFANDHYKVYEFLIFENKIIKNQNYNYDVAGVEGMEYSNFAAFLEFILLILVTITYFVSKIIMRKVKRKNKKTADNSGLAQLGF